MKCPHCNSQINIPRPALYNADAYHQTVLTVTTCCGKGVHLTPIRDFKVSPYTGDKKEDDWGNVIK
jgi:hypothetical protein